MTTLAQTVGRHVVLVISRQQALALLAALRGDAQGRRAEKSVQAVVAALQKGIP